MSDSILNDDDVRNGFRRPALVRIARDPGETQEDYLARRDREMREAAQADKEAFDAWLSSRDTRVRVEILREVAEQLNDQMRRSMVDPVEYLESWVTKLEKER